MNAGEALPHSFANASPEVGELAPVLPEAWRDYFLALLARDPRFSSGRRLLRRDIASVMRRVVPDDARVLEVGVGGGHLLAALPNAVRHGIDVLPEAIAAARARDPAMRVALGDVLTFSSAERYGAIVCDRLLHTIPDVQR